MNAATATYAHWRGLDSDAQTPRYRAICAEIGENDSVLDVGCGTGVLLGRLRACGYSGRYFGFERDARAIAEGRERYGADLFAEADEAGYEGPDKFDRIVLSEVLYYMPDPITALRRCLARLNDGGSLIVTIYMRPRRPRIKAVLRSLFTRRPRSQIHCAQMVSRAFPRAESFDVHAGCALYRVWKITAQC